MKVSVIIPLYNHGALVAKAIDSALSQPCTHEVIVVDDGSTDGGGKGVEHRYADHHQVKLLNHPGGAHRGAGASRNLGIAAAEAPWLAFLDADDYMLPGRFDQTGAILGAHPGTDAVAEALGFEGRPGKCTMLTEAVPSERLFFEMEPFGKKGHFSVCALTVSKKAALRAGPFDESLRIGEDTDWLARLTLTGTVLLGDRVRPVAMRGIHGGRSLGNRSRAIAQKRQMALKLFAWNADRGHDPSVARTILKLFLKYHYEATHIFGRESKWWRKLADIRAIWHLWRIYPSVWNIPRFRYFVKTVFHVPVDAHFDYYH